MSVWKTDRIHNPYRLGNCPEVYYKVYKIVDPAKPDTKENRYYMPCGWPTVEGAEKAAGILNRKERAHEQNGR